MPSTRHAAIVSSSDRNRLLSPIPTMKPTKFVAAPVSVSTPMITPTCAHAVPTGSALRAPSASASSVRRSVLRPPLMNRQATTSSATIAKNTVTPSSKKPAHASPSTIQNRIRIGVPRRPSDTAMPSSRIAVSARPTMPENSGV